VRTIRKKNRDVEDASEWAGWVFADMLVGLMVIFLATITFVPFFAESNPGAQAPAGSYTYTERFRTPFVQVYDSPDIDRLKRDIAVFLADNGIPKDAIVDSSFFAGGFDAATETASDGMLRALEFSRALDKADTNFLTRASTLVNSTTSINPNQVAVRLTFSSRVSVTN
jgi:hypothetical protein